MAQRWIVTALGGDRPGIVAGVTKVLYTLGCNLEDSAMTRLEGEFAIMLIFSGAASVSEARLRAAFAPIHRRLGLVTHLKKLSRQETRRPNGCGKPYRIAVYGADRAGIVFRVADLLARSGANITDVHTHRSALRAPSLYLLLLEVELPRRVRTGALERALKQLGSRLAVQVSMQPSDADIL